MRHIVKDGQVTGWDYIAGDGRHIALLPEQVIHGKFWNPYDRFRGCSEMHAARDAAESDYMAGKFNKNLMANNGDQGVFIVAKDGLPSDGQRQMIIDQLREKRELAQRGQFRAVFLAGDVEVQDPRVRVPDDSFINVRLQNRHEIFIAWVCPRRWPMSRPATRSASASDWFMLITETCMPTGERICQAISRALRRQTGLNLSAALDWDEHPVLQAVRRERADTAQKYFQMGVPMRVLNDYWPSGCRRSPAGKRAICPPNSPLRNRNHGGAPAPSHPTSPTMTEEQFHDSVLKGVHTLDEKIDPRRIRQRNPPQKLRSARQGTRRAMEDMTHLKNTANDHARILQSIQKLQSCLRTEARATGLDPIQRWSQDERKRGLFNAAVRSTMCDNDSEYKRFVAPILKAIGEDSGEGSTMIVAQLFREIYDTLAQYGDWSTLGVRRLGTKVTNFPVKTARVVANWITTEASPISDDANEVGTTLTLTVLPNAVLLNVSRQLIEDSEFDVTAIVMEDFQQAFNLRLDTAALRRQRHRRQHRLRRRASPASSPAARPPPPPPATPPSRASTSRTSSVASRPSPPSSSSANLAGGFIRKSSPA